MGAMDALHLEQAIKKKPRLIQKERVALIGSGNWGSTASRIVGANVRRLPEEFEDEVRMWVFEEEWQGRKLSEVINETKENPKYLPGIRLCDNLVAEPDLAKAVSGATMLVFVTPHQFVTGLLPVVKANMGPNAKACSLIKGMNVTPEGFQLVSELVRRELGVECSVLMGANIAGEIAREGLSESTLGYGEGYEAQAELWRRLFHTSYFHVTAVPDPQGVELCGTLKNVVATGAGFSDGLGLGNNAKASIACLGLMEMLRLGREFFPGIQMSTLFESAGVADVLTSIYGGRNWKCGEAFARAIREGRPKTFEQLEEEMLHGQKLQGVLTAHEVRALLRKLGAEDRYPLFTTIDRICVGELKPEAILQCDGKLGRAVASIPPQVPAAGHRHRVAVIGSGNWGSVAARIVAQNTRRLEEFEPKVRMWVWEQDWQGQELSSVINEAHENPKYLPGIKLGENLVAEPDLAKAVAGATMVLFAVPYPFLAGVIADLKHLMPKQAKVCSLVKGLRAKGDGLELPSHMIKEELGLDPCVLMGATIASELAFELFSEASVGYPAGCEQDALLWQRLFRTSYFRVSAVPHPLGMEMCGTLTSVVALGGGFCDAMALGNNTKAAIVRVGLREVQQLAEEIFPGFERDSLFEHAGVADLIATCYGGRTRRCAEAFVRSIKAGKPRSFQELEADLMQGQRLQALDCLKQVQGVLERRGTWGRYPLFSAIQRICRREAAPESLVSYAEAHIQDA